MATLTEWLQGWREIADALKDGGREPITMTYGGRSFEVLVVSTYETGMEDGLVVAKIASRDFDSRVALYSRRTRDTGLTRLITSRGVPRFALRPGEEAMEWASAVEGVPVARLLSASRPGAAGRGIANRARREKWSLEKLEQARLALEGQIEELEVEVDDLRDEVRKLVRELERSATKR